MKMHYSETASRILDAAENLYIENGFAATSFRMVALQSSTCIGNVSHYFKNKTGLFESVILRRVEPWVTACLAELETEKAKGEPMSPKALIMTYIRPLLDLADESRGDGIRLLRVLARAVVDDHSQLREIMTQQYGDFFRRYRRAFKRALPSLSDKELTWRMNLCVNAIIHFFAGNTLQRYLERDSFASVRDLSRMAESLVLFVLGGLTAPSPTPVGPRVRQLQNTLWPKTR